MSHSSIKQAVLLYCYAIRVDQATKTGNMRVIPEKKRTNDRMLMTDVILECKTANAYSAAKWRDTQEHEIRTGYTKPHRRSGRKRKRS